MQIFIVHGLGGSPESPLVQSIDHHLRKIGHDISLVTLPGHGQSDISLACDFTYTQGSQYLQQCIQSCSTSEKCVIIGICGGGVVAARTVKNMIESNNGVHIAGLVLINTPAFYRGESLQRKYRIMTIVQHIFGGIPYFFREKKSFFGLCWLKNFYVDALNFSPVDDVLKVDCLVHILGSSRDMVIPADHQLVWRDLTRIHRISYSKINSNHSGRGAELHIQEEIETFLKTL